MTTTVSPALPSDVRAARAGLAALGLAGFVAVTTEMLPIGLLPSMGAGLGIDADQVGHLVTLYAAMVAVLSVPLTRLTRRLPRKPLLLATVAGYAASNLVVALAPSFAVVAVGRTLGGITHAMFFSVCIGYAARLVGPGHVGRAMATVSVGISVGLVAGVPLSTSLGTAWGWRAPFLVLTAVAVGAGLIVNRVLPAVGNGAPDAPARRTRRGSSLAVVATTNGLAFTGQFVIYTYVSLLLIRSGAAGSAVGPALLGLGACGLLGLVFAGRTLDRHPRSSAISILAAVVVGLIAVGLAFPSLALVLVAAAVWTSAFGAVPTLFQFAAVRSHAAAPETAGAWINASSNVGIGAGAAIGGALLSVVDLAVVAWVGAAVVALGLVVVLVAHHAFPGPAATHHD